MLKTIAFIFLICASFTTFADSDNGGTTTTEGRSAANRQDKKWGWFGDVSGLNIGNINMYNLGVGVNYFINPNNLIVAEIGTGTNVDFVSSFGGDTVNGWTNWQGIYYKHFFNNSFYIKGGIEFTEVRYNVTHYELTDYSQSAYINLYSLYVAIGNQWQFRTFTLGCDWVAADLPFANTSYSETDVGTPNNAWNLKSNLTNGGLTVARFYLGMNF
jgi:hypothetical protein